MGPGPLQVQDEVNKKIAELMAWSFDCASTGVAPARGFYGERFPANTARHALAGKELAGGWKNFAFF